MQIPFLRSAGATLVLALVARSQQVVWTFTGSVGDEYGATLLQTADQNSDGYPDVMVGAPGYNSGRGYIRCVSGRFLATGAGSTTLWTLYPAVVAGARFGSAIAEVGQMTGDAAIDYVVGAPGVLWGGGGTVNTGAVMLVDGSTHAITWTILGDANTRLGASIAAVGDQDGDGLIDIGVNAPSTVSTTASYVHVIDGYSWGLTPTLQTSWHFSITVNNSSDYGATVASGFDLDHDGRFDLAVGSPLLLGGIGVVNVWRADGSWDSLGICTGQTTSAERAGASVDGTKDFNGDGFVDMVVGSPFWSSNGTAQDGRVVVVSGQQLLVGNQPRLLDLRFGSAAGANNHFGACVRASADLNGDGVPDILVGAPDYAINFIGGSINRGALAAFSGATGVRFGFLSGANGDHLGDALLGGALDMNGDGHPEFAVAGSLSDNSTTDCGTLKFCSLFPSAPTSYCTSKTNSLGCTPSMVWNGTASVSSSAAFTCSCFNAINQTSGLLFYAHTPNATSFQGGTMCVGTPLRRTPLLNAGGSATGADCSGVFQLDFKTYLQSGADPTLVAGSEVFLQCWARDPASPSTTSLSNAVRFLVNP
jgi:hypothetical protein